ncbi:MAG: hypothetical protein JWQ49_5098 [Edaphobacter sp.]|jgi:putative Holliday junction resolvase|nr:hypothetical protein [Edaphobacter sp.]
MTGGGKYVIDQIAAVVILRGWIESREQAAARSALVQSNLRDREVCKEK